MGFCWLVGLAFEQLFVFNNMEWIARPWVVLCVYTRTFQSLFSHRNPLSKQMHLNVGGPSGVTSGMASKQDLSWIGEEAVILYAHRLVGIRSYDDVLVHVLTEKGKNTVLKTYMGLMWSKSAHLNSS